MKILYFREKNNNCRVLTKLHIENVLFIIFTVFYILFSLSTTLIIYSNTQNSIMPKPTYTILIDAGHGGIDGGAVGSKILEKEVNLILSKKIENLFLSAGFNVIMTRNEDICLGDETANDYKLQDMKARRKVIQDSGPDLVVSIHCNKFHLKDCIGAQVFYQVGSIVSKELAECMTDTFVKHLPNARTFPLSGDFYILNSTESPAVLIECGYLSNPEEEELLITDEYQNILSYNIFNGIMRYLLENGNYSY